jgi:hypothetical protein
MAKRSTPNDKILVDPLFSIPEGAEDQFSFSREGADIEVSDETDNSLDGVSAEGVDSIGYEDGEDTFILDDGFSDQNGATLDVPQNFSIISQVIRRAPGGQQVVDVVLNIPDVAGAINYEVQVTKV